MPNIWDILFGKKVHVAPASHQVENKTKHTIDSDALKGADDENNSLADALNSVPPPTVNTYTPHDGYMYTLGDKYAQKIQNFFNDVSFIQVKVVFERNNNPYEVMIVWKYLENKTPADPNKPIVDAFKSVESRFDDGIKLELKVERKNKATILIGGK